MLLSVAYSPAPWWHLLPVLATKIMQHEATLLPGEEAAMQLTGAQLSPPSWAALALTLPRRLLQF